MYIVTYACIRNDRTFSNSQVPAQKKPNYEVTNPFRILDTRTRPKSFLKRKKTQDKKNQTATDRRRKRQPSTSNCGRIIRFFFITRNYLGNEKRISVVYRSIIWGLVHMGVYIYIHPMHHRGVLCTRS